MNRWPLVDDEDPYLRLAGVIALATGVYWLIAPLFAIAEIAASALDELLGTGLSVPKASDGVEVGP